MNVPSKDKTNDLKRQSAPAPAPASVSACDYAYGVEGVGSGMKPPCVCLAGENRFVMRFDVSNRLVSSRTLLPPVTRLIGQFLISHLKTKRVNTLRHEMATETQVRDLDVWEEEKGGRCDSAGIS